MMDCDDYKRALLADPHHPSGDMRAHVSECAACAAYTERVLRFEDRLEAALRIPVTSEASAATPRAAAPGAARPARRRRRWLAAAASVLLAAGVTTLWLIVPGRSLAAAVVDHMAEEPDAWRRTDVPVDGNRLVTVLTESHVRLRPDAALVSYANRCRFRGHGVPHLVVQTREGPVTVMVLPQESVMHTVHFDEQGYRGVIVPVAGHGSIAVLEKGRALSDALVEGVAAEIRGALDYLP